MRPGEKLFEELLNEDEIHPDQVYEKIYRGKSKVYTNSELLLKVNRITNGEIDVVDFVNRSDRYFEA